jgi:hypothetical protein
VVPCTVNCIGVWRIGDAQQHVAQRFGELVKLGNQCLFGITHRTTLSHQSLGCIVVTRAAKGANLFRKVIHFGACGVSFGCDITQSGIEGLGLLELHKKLRLMSSRQQGTDHLGVISQKSNVNH